MPMTSCARMASMARLIPSNPLAPVIRIFIVFALSPYSSPAALIRVLREERWGEGKLSIQLPLFEQFLERCYKLLDAFDIEPFGVVVTCIAITIRERLAFILP